MRDENLINEDGEEVIILLEDEDNQETAYIDTKLVEEELSRNGLGDSGEEELFYEDEITYEEEPIYEDEIVYEEVKTSRTQNNELKKSTGAATKARIALEDDDEEDDDESIIAGIGSKVVIGMGIVVAILAIVMGVFLLRNRAGKAETVDFSEVGNELVGIGVIGGDNIEAITTAQGARLEELYEAVKSYDYDEADEESGITTVNLSFTSILKDLKIKCVNKKDKLIANVPFQVEITDPKGKTYIVTDEDKDGIIYLTDIEGGAYKVKLVSLSGYDTMYDFSETGIQSVSVKSQLDYKKVDVSNEIKKATDAISAKEDTKIKETAVESKLTDTVGYVMSSKTLISDGYTAVDKATKVTDPIQTLKKTYEEASVASRFFRLSDVDTPEGNNNEQEGGNTSVDNPPAETHTHDYKTSTSTDGKKHKKTCANEGCDQPTIEEDCTFDDSGKCIICGYEKVHEHSYEYTKDPDSPGKHKKTCKNTDGLCKESPVSEECTYENGICKFCKYNKNSNFVLSSVEIKGDASISFVKDSTATYAYKAVPTIAGTKPTKDPEYKWEMTTGAGTVISVPDQILNKDTVTIKPVAAGKAAIKCTVTYTLDDGSQAFQFATYNIDVVAAELTLSHTGKKLLFVNGEEIVVEAKLGNDAKEKLVWSVNDGSIASVVISEDTHSAKVKAHDKAGKSVTITVASEKNPSIKKEVTFVVMNNPKTDKVTKLLDNEGKALYVYDANSKTYKEAVYADYYTNEKLYVAGGTGGAETYKYTGWWKLDGKTYYFDANGKKVTGDQVINGAKYSFGSDGALKSGTGTFGIDVSVWNGTIDWTKVAKSGVNYAIIRCGFRGSSEGGLYADNKFAQNISNATKAGIKVGVYFFTQAVTEAEAVEEASMCINLVNGYSLAYPIFIDVESSGGRADGLSKDQRTAIINAFCKTVANSGYKAGVYANKNWFENKINASSLTGYTIWLAQYASKATYSQTRYDMWQYSSKGSISGISGDVDLNLSYVGY